jgi:hypothetical protein
MTRAPAPPAPPALWVFPCPVQLTLELGPDGRLAFVSDIHLSGGGPASDFTATSALAELLTCLYDDPGQVIARVRRRHARPAAAAAVGGRAAGAGAGSRGAPAGAALECLPRLRRRSLTHSSS